MCTCNITPNYVCSYHVRMRDEAIEAVRIADEVAWGTEAILEHPKPKLTLIKGGKDSQ